MGEHHEDDDTWTDYFACAGHRDVRMVGAGVEGDVYRLGEGQVAKVWTRRPPEDIHLLHQIYADIARCGLPFATPSILRTEQHQGVLITYERELAGSPLGRSAVGPRSPDVPDSVADALLRVLRGFAAVPGSDAMRCLAVQGDDRPLWQDHARFPEALAALVERASRRHGDLLVLHLPGISDEIRRIVQELRAVPDVAPTLIHGDLVPPNIHVDEDGRPVAVLDFGFFTTAGDPAFEAAVTAAVWDMYGPHAEQHAMTLTQLFSNELGYSPDTLLLYQTAYALTTYDLFTSDGRDGHFAWCVSLLRRSLFSGRGIGRYPGHGGWP